MDLGAPVSYKVLAPDTKVFSSDGKEVGEVVHVLAAEDADIFDGIVIRELGVRNSHRFADADQIGEIHQRGVILKLDHKACAGLPEPSANPAVMRDDPADPPSGELAAKLSRAWNYLSGKY